MPDRELPASLSAMQLESQNTYLRLRDQTDRNLRAARSKVRRGPAVLLYGDGDNGELGQLVTRMRHFGETVAERRIVDAMEKAGIDGGQARLVFDALQDVSAEPEESRELRYRVDRWG